MTEYLILNVEEEKAGNYESGGGNEKLRVGQDTGLESEVTHL